MVGSILIAMMAALGATLAQIANHWLLVRREDDQNTQKTKQVLRSIVSDMDYCAGYLIQAAENLKASGYDIGPHELNFHFSGFSHQYFNVMNQIQPGIYHRYLRPMQFAEKLSDLFVNENSYTVGPGMTESCHQWSRYAAYLADALEEVASRPQGGLILDFAEYSTEKIDARLAKLRFTSETK